MITRRYCWQHFFLAACMWWFGALFSWSACAQDCVILVHGMFRTSASMTGLQAALQKQHYVVVNRNYLSTRKTIKQIAVSDLQDMIDICQQSHPRHIDFVTHSIGGRIVLAYMQTHKNPLIHHIVMLGPPNHGSVWVNALQPTKVLPFILGPAVTELTTQSDAPHVAKGNYKIGIIAGNFSMNPMNRLIFHEPNDGKVAVSATRLDEMDDFIVLPVSHTFMMRNLAVEKEVLFFLEHGVFAHLV